MSKQAEQWRALEEMNLAGPAHFEACVADLLNTVRELVREPEEASKTVWYVDARHVRAVRKALVDFERIP